MTTTPSEGSYFSGREPHQAREMAESFGIDAARYDRARPSYPQTLVDRIVAASPDREILDVGCGTGIAARQFQAAGCAVLGIEPDARMADFARHRGLDVEVSKFEDWDDAGRRFDAVIAGQSWHWVDPVAGATTAARVLRPGGRLAVFWNAFEPPAGLAEAFTEAGRRVLPDSPFFQSRPPSGAAAYSSMCEKAAGGMRRCEAFGEPERWLLEWDRPYTRDEWLDTVPTAGIYTQLPPAAREEILTGIGAAIDAAGGGFTTHFTTVTLSAARL